MQLVDTLQRVVEGDDGAITRVPFNIIDDILCGEPFGVVAGDEVPHHDLKLATEPGILSHAHPAVRRTDIMALDIGIGLLHIIAVFLDGVGESLNVVVGMITHLMALGNDTLIEFGVLPHVIAHHEEDGLGIKLF